ncbi:unnamed protein product [Rhizophagus irregularis]|nr:unnamed protein product [Rhizophagus irregularis]CAB5384391.1 unnamed protein product [Rhizophagus irregularis]
MIPCYLSGPYCHGPSGYHCYRKMIPCYLVCGPYCHGPSVPLIPKVLSSLSLQNKKYTPFQSWFSRPKNDEEEAIMSNGIQGIDINFPKITRNIDF